MNVLLFSPIEGYDPPSGDTSYTQALLDHPPPGVTYTTYIEALQQGTLRWRGRRKTIVNLDDALIFAFRSAELSLRRIGATFREPINFISVEPGTFDLVHQHVFNLRQVGSNPVPVVTSAGYPLPELYAQREGWNTSRNLLAVALDQALAVAARADVPWRRLRSPGLMSVYTDHFRQALIQRGIPESRVAVLGTFLPPFLAPETERDGRTLAVIARDFHPKGGDLAIEAFGLLRKQHSNARLIVVTTAENRRWVGSVPGVEVLVGVDRTRLIREVLPRVDVLLAPTRYDCGVPYTMLEALYSGCPIVTSRSPWLDEALQGPGVQRVSLKSEAIAEAAAVLLGQLPAARAAARELWHKAYSPDAFVTRLGDIYARALNGLI